MEKRFPCLLIRDAYLGGKNYEKEWAGVIILALEPSSCVILHIPGGNKPIYPISRQQAQCGEICKEFDLNNACWVPFSGSITLSN